MEQYRTRDELRAAIRENKKRIERLDQVSSDGRRLGLSVSESSQKEYNAALDESNALKELWAERRYK
jgi:hypothetical protein